MRRIEFQRLVSAALRELPSEFKQRLENIDIVVQAFPTARQRGVSPIEARMTLLGLYEGVPLTQRGEGYNMVLPDRITIFQRPIERMCRTDDQVIEEVRRTVFHEIGHHFGLSDARLEELERQRRERGTKPE